MSSLFFPTEDPICFGDRIRFETPTRTQGWNDEDVIDGMYFTTAQKIANFCEELLAQNRKIFSAWKWKDAPEDKIRLFANENKIEPDLSQAGKIALICTLILPLFALIYKAIYRGITLGQLTIEGTTPKRKDSNEIVSDEEKETESDDEEYKPSERKMERNRKRDEEYKAERKGNKERRAERKEDKAELEGEEFESDKKELNSSPKRDIKNPQLTKPEKKAENTISKPLPPSGNKGIDYIGNLTLRALYALPIDEFKKVANEFSNYTEKDWFANFKDIPLNPSKNEADWKLEEIARSLKHIPIRENEYCPSILPISAKGTSANILALLSDTQISKLGLPLDPADLNDKPAMDRLRLFFNRDAWWKKHFTAILSDFLPQRLSRGSSEWIGGGHFSLPREEVIQLIPDDFLVQFFKNDYQRDELGLANSSEDECQKSFLTFIFDKNYKDLPDSGYFVELERFHSIAERVYQGRKEGSLPSELEALFQTLKKDSPA